MRGTEWNVARDEMIGTEKVRSLGASIMVNFTCTARDRLIDGDMRVLLEYRWATRASRAACCWSCHWGCFG